MDIGRDGMAYAAFAVPGSGVFVTSSVDYFDTWTAPRNLIPPTATSSLSVYGFVSLKVMIQPKDCDIYRIVTSGNQLMSRGP
jgi:hypothetical protein